MSKETKTELIKELYINGKESSLTIAKNFGLAPRTVLYHLGKAKCTRSQSEAAILAYEQHRLRKQIGSQSPWWKGGKYIRKDGYVAVWRPEHPRQNAGGYALEHILVWEQSHGKSLPEGFIVHHLNGNKSDNRKENLVAIKKKDHDTMSLIRILQQRISELETLLADKEGSGEHYEKNRKNNCGAR